MPPPLPGSAQAPPRGARTDLRPNAPVKPKGPSRNAALDRRPYAQSPSVSNEWCGMPRASRSAEWRSDGSRSIGNATRDQARLLGDQNRDTDYHFGCPKQFSVASSRRCTSHGPGWCRTCVHGVRGASIFFDRTINPIRDANGPRCHFHSVKLNSQPEPRADSHIGAEVASSRRQPGVGKACRPRGHDEVGQESYRKSGGFDLIRSKAERDSGEHSLKWTVASETFDLARDPPNDRADTECPTTRRA